MATCQTCWGKGTVECPHCKGTGKVETFKNLTFELHECKRCRGTRKIDCRRCHATGKVPDR